MTFNPEEWRKLSERQRQAIIRKIEREEKRAKTAIVVVVYILVFAFLLFLFALMSSCPPQQDATPPGQGDETQARHKPIRGISPEPHGLCVHGLPAHSSHRRPRAQAS